MRLDSFLDLLLSRVKIERGWCLHRRVFDDRLCQRCDCLLHKGETTHSLQKLPPRHLRDLPSGGVKTSVSMNCQRLLLSGNFFEIRKNGER